MKILYIFILTKDAFRVGTVSISNDACSIVTTVMAPGGKPVITCKAHMKAARIQRTGEAANVDFLKIWKGFDLMARRSSIVETFIVCTRKRCQRYWAKATDKAARRKKPKELAIMFEAVVIYD